MAEKRFAPMKEFQKQKSWSGIAGKDLQTDFLKSNTIGNVKVGTEFLFHKSVMAYHYVPINKIVWAYLRQEDSSASLCCGRAVFPTFFLVLYDEQGNHKKITLEKREEAEEVLYMIKKVNENSSIGYYPEFIEKYEIKKLPQK